MLQLANERHFLRTFLAKPFGVTWPVPSCRELAQAVAVQVEPSDDPILELGPGTGSVTEATLARGVTPSQLIAAESDNDFAQLLRTRFPQSQILDADAFALEVLRGAGYEPPFGSIVCGVPTLTQPMHVHRNLLSTAIRWLRPGSPFVQFSYGARPLIPPHHNVRVHHAEMVWQNLLPTHIWVYRAPPAAQ